MKRHIVIDEEDFDALKAIMSYALSDIDNLEANDDVVSASAVELIIQIKNLLYPRIPMSTDEQVENKRLAAISEHVKFLDALRRTESEVRRNLERLDSDQIDKVEHGED